MASGGLKSAKNADAEKFTFLSIKESMDRALLDEIDQLKQSSKDQEEKYAVLLPDLQRENCTLRERLDNFDSAAD